MVPKAVPAKRKQATDMADSPPKRVTRARAAKAPQEIESKAKVTKSTTASTKTAATNKKASSKAAAAPPKTTKRKAEIDAAETKAAHEGLLENEVKDQEHIAPTRTRQKKAIKNEIAVSSADVPASRNRQPKPTTEKPKLDTAIRGKPKKSASVELEQPKPDPVHFDDEHKSEPVKKNTRGRATALKSTTTTTAAKTTKSKKKVQFEDDQDKENAPLEVADSKKVGTKSTDARARPVRKPYVPRTVTRRKKALEGGTSKDEASERQTLPLSPKKVSQVAKTPSISDDELLGEKTIVKTPAQSPVKAQISPSRVMSSMRNPSPGKSVVPSSPSKQTSPGVLGSPARRPPQSPFRDSMKTSPMKFDLGDSVSRSTFSTSQSLSPVKGSLLRESPKKANLPAQDLNSDLPPSQISLKASLLQSSARRPLISPTKTATSASVQESAKEPFNLQASPRKVPLFPSSSTVSSRPLAAKSPDRLMKLGKNENNGEEMAHDEYKTVQKSSKAEDSSSHENSHSFVDPTMYQSSPNDTLPNILTDAAVPAISYAPTVLRRISVDSQLSEDELSSPDKKYTPTPLRKPGLSCPGRDTPFQANDGASLTPLANQLSGWFVSSPKEQRPSRQQRGIFSFVGRPTQEEFEEMKVDSVEDPPGKTSFFEDEMAVIDADSHASKPERIHEVENVDTLRSSIESQASQEYGDENALPTAAEMLRVEQEANDHTLTCTPAKVFTPVKQTSQRPQEICTVSKVPLRPSAEDLPVKIPRQRSKSVGGALNVLADSMDAPKIAIEQPATPQLTATEAPQVPSSGLRLDTDTPGRNVRKNAVSSVLKGAVVHVDVHTSEGADASGIFVDLLTQMGARCVRQWNWNPRATLGASLNDPASPHDTSPGSTTPASKIGITHVVYKDGGKRTLEKVRISDGVVMCVGVGWVLE